MHFGTCAGEFLLPPLQAGGGWPLPARSGSLGWYGVLVLDGWDMLE